MTSKGIDYGMGQTNIDHDTGIRYGVIPMNDLGHWAWESFEDDYGSATCPKCGNEVVEWDSEKHDDYEEYRKNCCCDFACEECKFSLETENCYGEEPLGSHLDDGDYKTQRDGDNDVFILKSPYYTHAQFCSPCAPGAGHLSHPVEGGVKTYCFGHDWFDDGEAPYPVYEVATGNLVPRVPKGWDHV